MTAGRRIMAALARCMGMSIVPGLAWAAVGNWAQASEQRFPPPDFTQYQIPHTVTAGPASVWFEYLDVALFAIALAAASYLALKSRSRRGLFGLTIFALAWFGFWRQGCVCPIGAIQNVTLAAANPGYAVPFSVLAIFALPLVFTLFFGRTFCAAVCPLGAVQELANIRPVKVPLWLEHSLGLLPFIYLGGAVLLAALGSAFIICQYDPFVGFFRLGGNANMIVIGASLLVIGLFVGRPYCRFLCPYGALLGLCSRLSKWHVKIPPTDCINCRLCEDACPYNAIRRPTTALAAENRVRGRCRLAVLLALAPVLVIAGGWAGYRLGFPLALSHSQVRLAERVRLEETQQVTGTTDASDAFRRTGRPIEELYRTSRQLVRQFSIGGALFGGWVGLVVGVKMVSLAIRRRRGEYEPDRAHCVSCGRCFWYCPVEQARLGLIESIDVAVPPAAASAAAPQRQSQRELTASAR